MARLDDFGEAEGAHDFTDRHGGKVGIRDHPDAHGGVDGKVLHPRESPAIIQFRQRRFG